jgi:hypothetical protein
MCYVLRINSVLVLCLADVKYQDSENLRQGSRSPKFLECTMVIFDKFDADGLQNASTLSFSRSFKPGESMLRLNMKTPPNGSGPTPDLLNGNNAKFQSFSGCKESQQVENLPS